MFIDDTKKRLKLFKNNSFNYFVLSGVLATLGNGLIYITLSWESYKINNTVGAITVLMACLWMPSILFGPFFGACADRFNRKVLLIISNIVRGCSVVIFSTCYILLLHPNIYILAIVLGIFVSFYQPAALPLMQEIVNEDQLVNANTTIDLLYELGTGIGMGVSGYLIIYFGSYVTMLIGGILFVCAGILNILMKYKKQSRKIYLNFSTKQIFLDYLFIVKYLKKNQKLIPIYCSQSLLLLMLMTLPILLLPYVQQILHQGSKEFALLEVIFSVGMICGGIFSPTLSNKLGLKSAIQVLMVIISIGLFIFAINLELLTTFSAYFFVGFGLAAWALIISYGQMFTENQVQGRLQASFFSLTGICIMFLYTILDYYGKNISVSYIYILESVVCLCGVILIWNVSQNSEIENDQDYELKHSNNTY